MTGHDRREDRALDQAVTLETSPETRGRLIARIAARLEHVSSPRVALATIVVVAGLASFLTSFGLLAAGLHGMAIRYGVSGVMGYFAFLAGIRLWVWRNADPRDEPMDFAAVEDLVDVGHGMLSHGGDGAFEFAGGGEFSGGGAGRSFGLSAGHDAAIELPDVDVDGIADAEEGALVLLPVLLGIALIVGLVGTVTVLVGAPALLAEVTVDAVIMGAVYRRLRRVPPRHWVHGVVRRTWGPLLALLMTVVAAAAVAQWLVPAADSIGDFFR